MDLPKYYIAGLRPVKVARTEDGRLAAYALSWMTGEFALAMKYLAEIDKTRNNDVKEVSEEEFNRQVEEFRKRIKEDKSR